MKCSARIMVFFLLCFLVLGQCLYAKENPAIKLARGIVNVVASPGAYVVETAKAMPGHDPVTGYFGGLINGTYRMVERIGIGVYDIATFPVPVPKQYEPVIQPPTIVDELYDWYAHLDNEIVKDSQAKSS